MPNELKFDVQFSRQQIEKLLEDNEVSLIVFSGTYSFDPAAGVNVWNMNAHAQGFDRNERKLESIETGCPRPCYNMAR